MKHSLLDLVSNAISRIHDTLFPVVTCLSWKKIGKRVRISHIRIKGSKFIEIGDETIINDKVWLAASPTGTECRLSIGNKVRIGRFSEIYALKDIVLEDGVVAAENVYISDNSHSFDDVNAFIRDQEVRYTGPVRIGQGSWIGRNACIMSCKIGRNCIIGAFSLVKNDVPDYSMVAGVPARIIKKYNFETKKWERV